MVLGSHGTCKNNLVTWVVRVSCLSGCAPPPLPSHSQTDYEAWRRALEPYTTAGEDQNLRSEESPESDVSSVGIQTLLLPSILSCQ